MTELIPAASPRALERTAGALAAGDVVAIPTDTLYGLAVSPFVPGATDKLFAAKQRPRDVALPVLVGDVDDVERLAVVPTIARRLIERFWPGGLTIVLPRRDDVEVDVGSVESTVGVRCPDDAFIRALARRAGPLAVTSANLHRASTPETAQEVAAVFGDSVAVIVDDGPRAGAASTVVDCTGDVPRVLREGVIATDALMHTH